MGMIKRNCDNCGKEYNADTRNLRRGWGRCCCKSCAAQLREKNKPGYNPERVALNNARRECWTDCPEPERYPLSYDGADFDQWRGLWIWNTWLKEKPPTQWSNAGGWYAVTESDVVRLCGATKLVLFICITSIQHWINKILKGFIFGNIDFICTFAETKIHRGITRQRYENKRERFIKTIGDR